MTPAKPKIKPDWIAIGKGVGLVLAGLGAVGGLSFATSEPSNPDTQSIELRINSHVATDSVRWVYTEKRLERIERLLERIDQKIDARHEQ